MASAIVYFRMLAQSLRSRLGLLELAFENLISFMVKIALIDGAQGVTRGTLTIFQIPTSLHQCTHYLDAFEFKQYLKEESHTATTIPTAIDSHPNEWNK